MQPLIAYLAQYPVVAALLGALLMMFIWSVIKGLLKLALMSGLVLGLSFFVTNQKAADAWVDRAGDAAHTAVKALVTRGEQALGELTGGDAGVDGSDGAVSADASALP